MADICLKKFVPDDLAIYIQKIIHKKRLKKVHDEFYEIIYNTFKSKSINISGGIGMDYMTCMKFNNNIYLGSSTITFLTNLMWNEFWCEFTHFKKNPKRNLSPMILHKITKQIINSNKPFNCCHKRWLS